MSDLPACFKAYDIRGRVPDELSAELATRIGGALAGLLRTEIGPPARRALRVAVGRDARLSSPALADALAAGLSRAGLEVLDLGMVGTEMVYFAVFHLGLDGGAMVTASHNPAEYNGLKLVRAAARPISGDSGLHDLGRAALRGGFTAAERPGSIGRLDIGSAYLEHLDTWVDPARLRPLKVVFDAGNGAAGPILSRLLERLPLRAERLRFEPDGAFPTGVPNPLLPENRALCAAAVREHGADLGVAFDGDFDRCFFFDERGDFVDGYYLVGLLAMRMLRDHPGARVLYEPRLTWNTVERVRAAGGVPVLTKTGHAFVKERMRAEDAVYGGEMSAHYYFRDFGYCDSGMIPWLLVLDELSRTGRSLGDLVGEARRRYPCSGERNRAVADPTAAIAAVRARWAPEALAEDETDGLSLEFADWRFNLRPSNTEALLRLNVEARGDADLVEGKTSELLDFLDGLEGSS